MSEQDYPRGTDESVDPADEAFVRSALARLTFLRPDEAGDPSGRAAASDLTMPDTVWERLAEALHAEAAGAASSFAVPQVARSRPSRAARWGGGLAAASVAVLVLGVGVTAMRGSSTTGTVVADAAQFASATAVGGQEAAVAADSAAELAASAPTLDPDVLKAPARMSFAGMVPPVSMLVDSEVDYSAAGLSEQVSSVMSRFGMDAKAMAGQDPPAPQTLEAVVPRTGFTASEQSLRDCITKLTEFAKSTALLVDRSTFEGEEAGVVVAPEYPVAPSPAPDMARLRVWVVDENCDITMQMTITAAG